MRVSFVALPSLSQLPLKDSQDAASLAGFKKSRTFLNIYICIFIYICIERSINNENSSLFRIFNLIACGNDFE